MAMKTYFLGPSFLQDGKIEYSGRGVRERYLMSQDKWKYATQTTSYAVAKLQ